ncbi:MAG: biotin carboxylase N-terminal domain-containing protein [Hyphomonadaceae bacterium]|nr:biotin carboxylase N-terminal domain-containing protein [Hyphomonadaceae bacterium]
MTVARPFSSLLIANRGEIVVRIAHTAREMGLRTVAVHSAADRGAVHAAACDSAVDIGGAAPGESYLVVEKILAAARASCAEAIHPGYGFLSENAAFADAVEAAGLVWIGPPASAIRAMGDKAAARKRAAGWGAPVLAGYDNEDQTEAALTAAAKRIGYPVMIKASAGGGGRGMRRVEKARDFAEAVRSAAAEALKAFGDGRLVLERAVDDARHIEIQVLADAHGAVVHLGERDCSIQRRHQKIIEEAPSPAVDEALRQRMGAVAVQIAREIGYVGAGTVEFLLDADKAFTFMEMNTRLQVEHPVTELVTGVDLVEQQLRVAMGEPLDITQDDVWISGHAVEARLCAEAPGEDFMPRTGALAAWSPAPFVRTDHALAVGSVVGPHYDSMLAKIIAHGRTRAEAVDTLARALESTQALGVETNRAFLARVARSAAFRGGDDVTTAFIARHFPDNAARALDPETPVWAIAGWLSAVATPAREWAPPAWRDWSNAAPVPLRWRLRYGERIGEGRVFARGCVARVVVDDRDVEIVGAPGAQGVVFDVMVDGAPQRVAYAWSEGMLWVSLGGDHAFEDLRLAPPARDLKAQAGAVAARMNGKIVAVLVEVGARVAAGTPLVTLEAMKMEHVMVALADARVAAVHVTAGEQVAPGRVLVDLAPDT